MHAPTTLFHKVRTGTNDYSHSLRKNTYRIISRRKMKGHVTANNRKCRIRPRANFPRGRDFISGGHANRVIACVPGVAARDDEVIARYLRTQAEGKNIASYGEPPSGELHCSLGAPVVSVPRLMMLLKVKYIEHISTLYHADYRVTAVIRFTNE